MPVTARSFSSGVINARSRSRDQLRSRPHRRREIQHRALRSARSLWSRRACGDGSPLLSEVARSERLWKLVLSSRVHQWRLDHARADLRSKEADRREATPASYLVCPYELLAGPHDVAALAS